MDSIWVDQRIRKDLSSRIEEKTDDRGLCSFSCFMGIKQAQSPAGAVRNEKIHAPRKSARSDFARSRSNGKLHGAVLLRCPCAGRLAVASPAAGTMIPRMRGRNKGRPWAARRGPPELPLASSQGRPWTSGRARSHSFWNSVIRPQYRLGIWVMRHLGFSRPWMEMVS